MDATRFGHAGPMPAALLREASGGAADLAAGDEAGRAAGALEPVTGAGTARYRLADYLDQYGRRTRADQAGTASLWDALAGHAGETGIGDLNRLAQAARDRGLYRHAAALRTAAAARGSTQAATRLVAQLGQGDAARAAAWAAARVRLDDPWEVSRLLEALRAAGAGPATEVLLARDPVGQVSLDHRWDVLGLLGTLAATGADDAVRTLLDRGPAREADPGDPWDTTLLMRALRAAGAGDAAPALAARAADAGMFDLEGEGASYPFGREPDGAPAAPWRWAEPRSG